jgi:hypothetical protein
MLANYRVNIRNTIRTQAMNNLRFFRTARAGKGLIALLLMMAGPFVLVESLLARQNAVPAAEMRIASKRTKDLITTITSADGRLTGGENSFCVAFQKRETEEPVDVQNVSVEFALLVGRIEEKPMRAQLTRDRVGRNCGHANLGKQYYDPASYYAFVLYADAAGKKSKDRLFLSIR